MALLKCIVALIILLEVLTLLDVLILPSKADSDIVILSETGYLDFLGYYHIVGEIQNVGEQSIGFVRIEVAFYTSNDNLIATRFNLVMLRILLVGRKSPFDVVLFDAVSSSEVHHSRINETHSIINPIPNGLKILTQRSYVDDMGCMHVLGEIGNIETTAASNVKLVATYYDGAGNVIAATSTPLDPIERNLSAGASAQFEILLDAERTAYVKGYELTAESNEYACAGSESLLSSDINKDGIVNILDLAIVARAFDSIPHDRRWNPDADIDKNGVINTDDLFLVVGDFGKQFSVP